MEIKTIKIFYQNINFLLKLSLLSIVLGVLSLGIFLPVFQTGFGYIFSRFYKSESVYYKDIFKFINKTLLLVILWLLLIIIFIISLIGIFLPVVVIAFLMFSPYILAYEDVGILEAMRRSCEIVIKNGFMKYIAIAIILMIIFLIGLVPFGLGLFFTFPLMGGYIGLLYEKSKS
jgi:uncharacterized membrane protein